MIFLTGFSSFSFSYCAESKRIRQRWNSHPAVHRDRQTRWGRQTTLLSACWKTFRYPFHCCSLSLLLDHGVSTFWITSSAFPPGCPSVHRGAVCVASLCWPKSDDLQNNSRAIPHTFLFSKLVFLLFYDSLMSFLVFESLISSTCVLSGKK